MEEEEGSLGRNTVGNPQDVGVGDKGSLRGVAEEGILHTRVGVVLMGSPAVVEDV